MIISAPLQASSLSDLREYKQHKTASNHSQVKALRNQYRPVLAEDMKAARTESGPGGSMNEGLSFDVNVKPPVFPRGYIVKDGRWVKSRSHPLPIRKKP